MKFVPMKTTEQQAILAMHSARSLLVKQQTMLVNAMRGLATEFGLTVPKGIGRLGELMALVDADEAFPRKREGCSGDCSTTAAHWLKVSRHSKRKSSLTRGTMKPRAVWHDPWRRSDHRVADRGNGHRYQCVQKRTALRRLARSGAAPVFHWREDPPRPDHQSGQPGDPEVAGARRHVDGLPGHNGTVLPGSWTRGVLQRRPFRLVTVALANKMARIAWALMTREEVYQAKGRIAAAAEAAA